MDRGVVCYDCGERYAFPRQRCDCGEPLWFDLAEPVASSSERLWRYADALPVDPPSGIARAVGGTPQFRAASLDAYAGCRLSIKGESGNPTGTFKDRGSAVGVAWAAERGAPVATVSHGNMAASTAALSAAVGLDCVVFVPDDIPAERLSRIALYGPEIVRVAGDYGRLYYRSLELGREAGIAVVNSDTPLRVAGQKTIAYEIYEHGTPDAIVLPVSSGGHASAVWKGLRELGAAGRLDCLPRLYLVQAAACAPIALAYGKGSDRVEPIDPGETVAYSIANPDPPSGNRALAAVRATDGAVVAVDDDAIDEARMRLARRAGLAVESSSAVALAGLRRLAAEGIVDSDDDVVMIATGAARAGSGSDEGSPDGSVGTPTIELDELGEWLTGGS